MNNQLERIWQKSLTLLKDEVSSISYNTWVRTIKPFSITSSTIELGVLDSFIKGILETRYTSLIKNAIEAVYECAPKQKIVSVTTSLINDKSVGIMICNKSEGIDEEKIQKMFDPFFTTKKQGMGMGLTISRTIIEAHNGQIKVSSDKKKGTCFQIILPINSS